MDIGAIAASEQMLGLNELRQTRGYQEALEEGLEQVRREGELAVVMRLLTRQLGTVEPELRSRLQQLSSAQLKELALALLDFTSKADLVTKVGSSIIRVDGKSDRLFCKQGRQI